MSTMIASLCMSCKSCIRRILEQAENKGFASQISSIEPLQPVWWRLSKRSYKYHEEVMPQVQLAGLGPFVTRPNTALLL